ncbi:hypothetical protein NEPAR05_1037 [Nematocida parisii]|nr:hypothetical protein NEPAR07_2038 [Nematocida parisii]KAI5157110.1 hypothetical protein NEPAR05_1037 [Nematocida parisii]
MIGDSPFELNIDKLSIEKVCNNHKNKNKNNPKEFLLNWISCINTSITISTDMTSNDYKDSILELAKLCIYKEIISNNEPISDTVHKLLIDENNSEEFKDLISKKVYNLYLKLENIQSVHVDIQEYFKRHISAEYINMYINYIQDNSEINQEINTDLQDISTYYLMNIEESAYELSDLYTKTENNKVLIEFSTEYIIKNLSSIREASNYIRKAESEGVDIITINNNLLSIIPKEYLKLLSTITINNTSIYEERKLSSFIHNTMEKILNMEELTDPEQKLSKVDNLQYNMRNITDNFYISLSNIVNDSNPSIVQDVIELVNTYSNDQISEFNKSIQDINERTGTLIKNKNQKREELIKIESGVEYNIQNTTKLNEINEINSKISKLNDLKDIISICKSNWESEISILNKEISGFKTNPSNMYTSQTNYIINSIKAYKNKIIQSKSNIFTYLFGNSIKYYVNIIQVTAIVLFICIYICVAYFLLNSNVYV